MNIPLFAHVAAFSCFIPAAAGIWKWKHSAGPLRWFILFLGYSVIHLIAEFILGRMGISNQFLLNYHQIVEFTCILFLYYAWVQEGMIKDLFQYFGMAYLLIWIINKFYFENPDEFGETISAVAHFFLIIASVVLLNTMFRTIRESIVQHSMFWIALGVLLYSAGTIAVMAFSNTILAMGMEYFVTLWHINWGFSVVANLLYTRSFLCKMF